jgi:hypothetical protein
VATTDIGGAGVDRTLDAVVANDRVSRATGALQTHVAGGASVTVLALRCVVGVKATDLGLAGVVGAWISIVALAVTAAEVRLFDLAVGAASIPAVSVAVVAGLAAPRMDQPITATGRGPAVAFTGVRIAALGPVARVTVVARQEGPPLANAVDALISLGASVVVVARASSGAAAAAGLWLADLLCTHVSVITHYSGLFTHAA